MLVDWRIDSPPNAKRRRFFLWMEPYEDWDSIKAKAREKGYVEGDEVIVISWQTEEEEHSHMAAPLLQTSSVVRKVIEDTGTIDVADENIRLADLPSSDSRDTCLRAKALIKKRGQLMPDKR